MRVPRRTSGLVPLELAADGRSLLAGFTGQGIDAGFAVDLRTGRIRALSRRLPAPLAATDLSSDGRTVLGTSGGNVVTVPYRGGRATVLVRGASEPRFTR
jgi:hypothetical protein